MSAHPSQSYFADAGLDGDAARPSARVESRPIFESIAQTVDELPGRLSEIPPSTGESRQRAWKRQLERWSKRVTIRNVVRLVVERRQVKHTRQRIPARMQLVTNQIRLPLQLIDDFVAGNYRQIPWHSMALAAGAATRALEFAVRTRRVPLLRIAPGVIGFAIGPGNSPPMDTNHV